MTLKQKLRQFFDYYMIQTLVALFVIIFAVITLKSMLSPREVNALAISVFDDVTDQDASDELCAELREKLGIDDKYTTVSITSGHDVNVLQDIMVLQVHAANNEADIIIAGEESFRWLAGTGYLQDLDSVFGDRISEIPKERIVAANPERGRKKLRHFDQRKQPVGSAFSFKKLRFYCRMRCRH